MDLSGLENVGKSAQVVVSERALILRLNRVLARDGRVLKKARGWNAIQHLGALYVLDIYRNVVVDQDVDLEDMAKEYRVLQKFERLESSQR